MATTHTVKLAQPEQAPSGKWRAAFESWATYNGEEYLSSSCTSAALFDTAPDAEEAGKRALATLEATGKYPNMCELW